MVYLCGSQQLDCDANDYTHDYKEAQVSSPNNLININLNIMVQTVWYKRIALTWRVCFIVLNKRANYDEVQFF